MRLAFIHIVGGGEGSCGGRGRGTSSLPWVSPTSLPFWVMLCELMRFIPLGVRGDDNDQVRDRVGVMYVSGLGCYQR